MRSRIKAIILILVPLLLGLGTFVYLRSALILPADPENKNEILVEIQPGLRVKEICKELEDKGLVKNGRALGILAKLKGVDTKINAGEYPLSPSMSPLEILKRLASGMVLRRKVTLTEGQSIWELGKIVDEAGLMPKDEFDKALTDPRLLVEAHILSNSFEGYLFPETYEFSRPVTAKQVIWKMMEEGEKHWSAAYTEKADQLKLTRHDVLTLASVIEKESGNVSEQRIISSVFHNRLNQGMKLQSDPTVIYGIPNFNGNLVRADLENENNRYNSYVYYGLPPGPIGNPGASAIEAALNPEQTNFLYFVADGSGGHAFAATLKEHNDNVNKYQRHIGGKAD